MSDTAALLFTVALVALLAGAAGGMAGALIIVEHNRRNQVQIRKQRIEYELPGPICIPVAINQPDAIIVDAITTLTEGSRDLAERILLEHPDFGVRPLQRVLRCGLGTAQDIVTQHTKGLPQP